MKHVILLDSCKTFGEFIKRITFAGKIPECVLTFKEDGTVHSHSMDMNKTCFTVCSFIGVDYKEPFEIGVSDIEPIAKFLLSGADTDCKLTVADDKVSILRPRRGKIIVRTKPVEDVGTAMVSIDISSLVSGDVVDVDWEKLEELSSFVNNTLTECIIFKGHKGKLYAESPADNRVQFQLMLADKCPLTFKAVTHAKNILPLVGFGKEFQSQFFFKDNDTIIVKQGNNFYGLANIDTRDSAEV